jgi:hypothetical protein
MLNRSLPRCPIVFGRDCQDFLALLLEMEEAERKNQCDESLPAGRQAPPHALKLSGETHRERNTSVQTVLTLSFKLAIV